ncbi:hypothetical protein ACQEVS_20140 [Streptomyces sp. CA-181903]|uniref:hypothetical protein n=1 Tax=Streptomyces sp. CA-181903 TaxID=3240055 RepID=UPI003D8B7CBA
MPMRLRDSGVDRYLPVDPDCHVGPGLGLGLGRGRGRGLLETASPGFRLDLREVVLTTVEGAELVVQLWRPGLPPKTFRRT